MTSSTFPLGEDDATPRFVYDLAQSLGAHFNAVHALAPGAPGADAEARMRDVHVHRFTYMWPARWQCLAYGQGMVQNLRRYPPAWLTVPFFIACQWRALAGLCRRHRFEVVNSHWIVFQGFVAALARRRGGYRHVLHVHAAGLYVLLRLPRRLGRALARFIVRRTDGIVCESNFVRARLDDLLGEASGAGISCMGVYTARFARPAGAPPPDPHRVIFVGRLVEKKGVTYLLQAMAALRRARPRAHLRIIGGGMLDATLRAEAAALGLMDNGVVFLGRMPHRDIIGEMHRAAVMVVPSIVDSRQETEGMPTVLLEAMAAGCRVVASRVNGTPDVVRHGENGWLAEPKDAADLAVKLEAALAYDGATIAANAQRTAAHYDWTRLAERYAAMLADARTHDPA